MQIWFEENKSEPEYASYDAKVLSLAANITVMSLRSQHMLAVARISLQ